MDMRRLLTALLFCLPLLGVVGRPAVAADEPEVLEYRWELKGFLGRLARIFIPGKGEGTIINRPEDDHRLYSEFRITSKGAEKEEFWSYGSLIDRVRLRPVKSWNESHFRDRDRRRETEFEELGIIDIPTGIQLLRKAPPGNPTRLLLWTDGRIYPALFRSHGQEWRRYEGRKVQVQASSVVGLDEPGQRHWEGRLDLWTTADERAIPIEILFRRDGAKVALTLVSPDPFE